MTDSFELHMSLSFWLRTISLTQELNGKTLTFHIPQRHKVNVNAAII